jgi:GntR family transcriptional repressor for pyruvate dehydrogenase complex
MIRDGALINGERIPSERELAELVGVSRASIREALRELELRGLLDRRPGRGTVVVDMQRPSLDAGLLGSLDDAGRLLREVMDFRSVVEPPIAERAAARGTPAELTELARLVSEAEDAHRVGGASVERYIELDVGFHLALARMTQNQLLLRLLEVSNEWMAPSRQSGLQTPQRIAVSLAAHRSICEAVGDRDPAAASAAMRDHIGQIQRLITSSPPPARGRGRKPVTDS